MTHKLSILLVEDEKNICDFISTSLSAQDYRISTAHTSRFQGMLQLSGNT